VVGVGVGGRAPSGLKKPCQVVPDLPGFGARCWEGGEITERLGSASFKMQSNDGAAVYALVKTPSW
jgi:hypothetical protein